MQPNTQAPTKGRGASSKRNLDVGGGHILEHSLVTGPVGDGDGAGDGQYDGAGHAQPADDLQALHAADGGLGPQGHDDDGGDADGDGPPAEVGDDQIGESVRIHRDPVDGGDRQQERQDEELLAPRDFRARTEVDRPVWQAMMPRNVATMISMMLPTAQAATASLKGI